MPNTFNRKNIPIFNEIPSVTNTYGRWYQTPTGEYPSITTILSHTTKQYLTDWRESVGIEYAEKETERCSVRGTAVHLMAEKYLYNDPSFNHSQSTSDIKLFNKLKRSLNNIDNIRIQEVPLYSSLLKLAGRVDCVAEYNGVLSIIDFKTSTGVKTKDMIEDYFIQCTAYAIMYHEMFGERIDQIVVMIACEKSIVPLVYVEEIEIYIPKLVHKIVSFYRDLKKNA